MKKVAIITGSRADWNGLGMVAKALQREGAAVEIIAIGQHYDSEESLSVIIGDGFDPHLSRTNFRDDMAIGCGTAAIALASLLDKIKPNMAVVLGDRFEILGAASAVAARGIPLAHIGGGDITEGSLDNKFRYAITALADLHFTTNKESVARIAVCGPTAINITGNPALDRIAQMPPINRNPLLRRLGLPDTRRNILVAYHAATREPDPLLSLRAMLDALYRIADSDTSFLVIGTNADTGSGAINRQLGLFTTSVPSAIMHQSLPPDDFYGCLMNFDLMVGNSSAGIVETASFGIPVVNIGDRQKGRPAPANVLHSVPVSEAIEATARIQMSEGHYAPCANPYGDGHSAPRIAKIIMEAINDDKGTEATGGQPESMANSQANGASAGAGHA